MTGLPAGAQDSRWLYEIDVPVADQSPAARVAGSRAALQGMLTRLTGLRTLPANTQVAAALANPERYYTQFGYQPGATSGELRLRVQFSPQTLIPLIREAGLPIWPTSRPAVLGWVVVDDGEGRRQLDASDQADDPVAAALMARARERGLVLMLAGMSAEVVSEVVPDGGGRPAPIEAGTAQSAANFLWEAAPEVLLEAAFLQDAELVLVARVSGAGVDGWSARWELLEGDTPLAFQARGADPDTLALALIDQLVGELLLRYQVQARGVQMFELTVGGLGAGSDYAAVLRLLAGLEVVDDVAVVKVRGDRVQFALSTIAEFGQLLALATADGRLVEDSLSDIDADATDLVWLGP